MAVVADEHDAVAGGDAEHGDEADERAEREHAAAQHRADDAADQGEGKREDDQRRQPQRCGSRRA